MMEVELCELIAPVTHDQQVAVSQRVVHAHGCVAVVDDPERPLLVGESDGGKAAFVVILMSIGDCSRPELHRPYAGSRLPQCSAPFGPS
jgi:hypothetical protein